jgi:hypothetical protein
LTPAEARTARAKAVERRRNDERLCALDFLTWGDTQGVHAKRCIHAGTSTPVCSREYNPGPVPEDEAMYEDADIGALWGLNNRQAWQLAGWNVTRRKDAA